MEVTKIKIPDISELMPELTEKLEKVVMCGNKVEIDKLTKQIKKLQIKFKAGKEISMRV